MKEFLPYETVRNDALKLASKIYHDGFIPDIIYTSLRGGAYMANVISEYFKLALKGKKPVLYAAVVARSYTDVHSHDAIRIDGWTYSPDYLRQGDKILLVDDIYDSFSKQLLNDVSHGNDIVDKSRYQGPHETPYQKDDR